MFVGAAIRPQNICGGSTFLLPKIMQKSNQAKPKAAQNPVAYTVDNRRITRMTHREARKLIAWGYADWRGRKDGVAVVCYLDVNSVLGYVGMERLRPDLEARCLDSKTHTYTGPHTYRHIRNYAYGVGIRQGDPHAPLALPMSVVPYREQTE